MGIRDQVSQEQMKFLLNGPLAAAMYVGSASGGGWELVKELWSAAKFIVGPASSGQPSEYGELVDELEAAIRGMSKDERKAIEMEWDKQDPAGVRGAAKQVVAEAVVIAANLPGAGGYRRWVLEAGRRAAATKSGGFLGIGAKSVIDDKEQAALDELAAVVNAVPASGEADAAGEAPAGPPGGDASEAAAGSAGEETGA